MKLYDLMTDNRRENILVGSKKPVFSWRVETEKRNVHQESYRVQVWDEQGNSVWDSGTVEASRMAGIQYEGKELQSGKRMTWHVSCIFSSDEGVITAEEESSFETAYHNREDWKGKFIGETKDHEYHLYRKKFGCKKAVKLAKLYVCGMGAFECWINGERVSDHVMEPGWTDFRRTCFYTAYDVSEYFAEGENTENIILVKLGDCMFNVPGGRYVYFQRSYGKAKLLCQLELVYEDGSREYVVTDESWKEPKVRLNSAAFTVERISMEDGGQGNI